MKVTVVTALLLCALVVFVKASPFAVLEEEQDENLEDELYELAGWDVEDPAMVPTKPPVKLKYVLEELLKCFLDEGKGKMRRKCIQRFKEHLPPYVQDKMRLVRCIVDSFKNCTKEPEGHGPMECMMALQNCPLPDMGGGEGSGNSGF